MQHPDQSIRGYLNTLIWLCLLLVICFVIGTMIQVGLRWQSMTQVVEPEVLSLTLPTIIATHTQPLIASTATPKPSPTSAITPTRTRTRTVRATVTLFPSPRLQASKTAQPRSTIVIEYIVQAGDTLSGIADKFHISLAELLEANPEQNASLLSINDVLIIPPRATPTPTNDERETYIVRSGDTLLGIANQFDISLPDLQAANPNLDPARLKIGDAIFIPDPSEKKE